MDAWNALCNEAQVSNVNISSQLVNSFESWALFFGVKYGDARLIELLESYKGACSILFPRQARTQRFAL